VRGQTSRAMSDGFVTVAQCVEGLPLGRFVWELLVCGFLCWFLLGAINESTPMAFSFVSTEWEPGERCATAMSAALALGNFLAILIGGWVADRHGRLSVVRPALLMTIACGMIVQTARNFYQAVVARFVLGLVSGSLLGVMPPLIAELLPARNRGFYLTIWCCGWPAGALFSIMVGCLLPSLNWRAFYTIILVPAIVLYVCTRADMLPESPRFLYLAGRRDEGYNTLLDMYETEGLPLPWAAETIAVTCAPSRPGNGGASSEGLSCSSSSTTSSGKAGTASSNAVAAWLAVTMFCVSAAAQSMKLWMPMMLVAHKADTGGTHTHQALHHPQRGLPGAPGEYGSLFGLATGQRLKFPSSSHFSFADGPNAVSLLGMAHAPYMLPEPDYSVVLVLAQAYIVEMVGVVVCAYVSTWVCRKHMVQWPLLAAAFFTLAALAAAEAGSLLLSGPLIGLQLAAQATGLNYLQVFASEYFPTSRRAKTTAVVNFAAQLGNFVMPMAGGLVVQRVSAAGALIFFCALYLVGWIVSLRLPLPVSREQPLHDVDEAKPSRDGGARARKRGPAVVNYQTI